MSADGRRDQMLWWSVVGMAALAGLGLRVAAAQGGLWTDEAWSAIYARQAGDAVGVFLRINHDNNHHLYSLWLLAVGMDAPVWLMRLPAILTGTAAIFVAALVADRRKSVAITGSTAIVFAVAPIFVTFGSAARGYAPMSLAALGMLLIVTRAEERAGRTTPWWLGLIAALGMLSHMTMAAPVALVALWDYFERRRTHGLREALRSTMRLMGPSLAATIAVAAFVFAAAAASPTGMQLGGYVPFEWAGFLGALDSLTQGTIGLSGPAPWLGPLVIGMAAAVTAVRPPPWLGARGRLYAILILGVPLGVALLHPGNSIFPRYYLCSALGLTLLVALGIGRGLSKQGAMRAVAATALAAIVLCALIQDWRLIRTQRGHPDQPVRLMATLAPGGTRVALDLPRFEGIVSVAAERAGYPVKIVEDCAPAEFFLSATTAAAPPAGIVRCGLRMRAIASASGTALTGDRWTLYRLQACNAPGPLLPAPLEACPRVRFHAERA
jgi:hypothetical protein